MTPAEKAAKAALVHLLHLISKKPEIAWYLGHGTQTRELALNAMALLEGRTAAEVEASWPVHPNPKNPAGEDAGGGAPGKRVEQTPEDKTRRSLPDLLAALDRRCADNAGRMATFPERHELEQLWREAGGTA